VTLGPREKSELFEAVQRAAESEPELGQGTVVSAVVVCEVVLPGPSRAIYHLSTTAGGSDLRTWEAVGLMLYSMARMLRESLR
jgi:hypothetical protein